jgi:CO/xanthine dehydrogenase FAD-binding subunit
MKSFNYAIAESFASCATALQESAEGKTVVMAGGTDLLGVLKGKLLKEYPETVISLKGIEDADYIKSEKGEMEIGAMTRLVEIAESDKIKADVPMLAEAAYSVATDHPQRRHDRRQHLPGCSPLVLPLSASDR